MLFCGRAHDADFYHQGCFIKAIAGIQTAKVDPIQHGQDQGFCLVRHPRWKARNAAGMAMEMAMALSNR
jgi:hypothetical protein